MAETPKRSRRPRRQFDDDFKVQAVRLVLDEGKSVRAVARDLDLTETALREWVHRARADRTKGRTELTTAEREEQARLRKENRELRTKREISKKSRGLLREAPGVKFTWIAAEKAFFRVSDQPPVSFSNPFQINSFFKAAAVSCMSSTSFCRTGTATNSQSPYLLRRARLLNGGVSVCRCRSPTLQAPSENCQSPPSW
jgi:transposase